MIDRKLNREADTHTDGRLSTGLSFEFFYVSFE